VAHHGITAVGFQEPHYVLHVDKMMMMHADKIIGRKQVFVMFQTRRDKQFLFVVEKKTGVASIGFTTDNIFYIDNFIRISGGKRDLGILFIRPFEILQKEFQVFK